MRILVFSWRDLKHPMAGGAEQVMHEHMKGWVTAGHKVTLFASKMKGLSPEESFDGVRIIRRGYQYWGVQFAGFVYYLENKDNYDFVVDQFHGIPFFTPLYVRKPRLAVIQEPAREIWFLNPLSWPLNWIVGIIGYLGEPFVFLLYRGTPFMTGSRSAKKDISRLGIQAKNITIVPHGVVVRKPKPRPPKEKKPTVCYLGVLSKDKGIEDALNCFEILERKGDFQFWVIGKAETERYFDRLKRKLANLPIKDKVKFWGFVSPKKKFELLARTHVLINPSVHEGWGLVNIEANAVGTPVVAYRSAGLVDSVKDGQSGILCRQNLPEKLAENVFSLLIDKKRYKRLQKGAVSWSENFSWGRSRKQSLSLIEKIVDSSLSED